MAREIEIRFKIVKNDLELLTQWLNSNADYIKETYQLDYYLDNPLKSFKFKDSSGNLDSEYYLRVRHDREKGDSVCLKIWDLSNPDGISRNIDEIEYKVEDIQEPMKLFNSLGYTDKDKVEKTRKAYKSKDGMFEIAIDEVKDLGVFVEVELLEQIEGDYTEGLKVIHNQLRLIGLTRIDVQKRGYLSMLWNKDLNYGEIVNL